MLLYYIETMAENQNGSSKLYKCGICHYNTLVSSSYDKHLLSAKHVMLTAEANAKVFRCDTCDYITIKKSCYDKHITSVKHIQQLRLIKNNDGQLVCNYCNKTYNSRTGLWLHKKKCSQKKNGDNNEDGADDPEDGTEEEGAEGDEDIDEDCADEEEGTEEAKEGEKIMIVPLENTIVLSTAPTPTTNELSFTRQWFNDTSGNNNIPMGLFLQVIKENQEFKSMMMEQQQQNQKSTSENKDLINKLFEMTQQHMAITNNITNNNTINNNQRFNLNVFLNETCKDAMNLDEFLDTIRPTFDELLVMGDVGFVDGISDIFIKRLRALDITKRPIHCTDAKRETIFLKENNVWTKDDNGHAKLNSIIEKVEYRNVVCLHQWCLDNPDAMVNNHEKNLLRDKIYLQTLLGDPKTRVKVVRNIAREVALDREAIMLQFGRR